VKGFEALEPDLRQEWRRHPAADPYRASLLLEVARCERAIIEAASAAPDVLNIRYLAGAAEGLRIALRIFDKE